MPVERPTFSESWYRVANLRPRLRATVRTHRQHFRGQMWYVVQDPSGNDFFRLTETAYRLVALLDGQRTVAEAWRICNEQLGDSAPTQGEAIQLFGQLYASNLIQAEMPPDAEGLFRRYRQRKIREVKGFAANLLFIKIPLFDPDRLLGELLPLVGWVFSWMGLVLLVALMSMGGYFIIGRLGELADRAGNILDPEGLPLLLASIWLAKICHEFGHCFACKKFGHDAGAGGEVHTLGIMFLVFAPLPYMDASSAYAFRRKWHRAIVGMAGVLVELGVASIAAVVWANTSPGTVHAIAYNVMFVAGVSTLVFNGNPLLRFDGYFVLADLLEMPNLSIRSKQYLYYLVRRYVWGIRRAQNPANLPSERFWFVFYGVASTVYRVFIVVRILLFVAGKLFLVGMVLAVAAAAAWLMVPLAKFLKYLTLDGELTRVRARATATVLAALVVIVVGVGFIPTSDRSRVEGVAEPVSLAFVHPLADGRVLGVMASDRQVSPESDVLVEAENPILEARLKMLLFERDSLVARKGRARTESVAKAQSFVEQIEALDKEIRDARQELANLKLRPPIAGRWISPRIDRLKGVYVKRGQQIGLIASDEVAVLAVVEQDVGARAFQEVKMGDAAEIRVKGRPDLELSGKVVERLPAGQKDLPSRALGYAVGGSVQTEIDDPEGRKADEPFFLVRIIPDPGSDVKLLAGQRVVARLSMSPKPLASQWWRGLLQLVQRRFQS